MKNRRSWRIKGTELTERMAGEERESGKLNNKSNYCFYCYCYCYYWKDGRREWTSSWRILNCFVLDSSSYSSQTFSFPPLLIIWKSTVRRAHQSDRYRLRNFGYGTSSSLPNLHAKHPPLPRTPLQSRGTSSPVITLCILWAFRISSPLLNLDINLHLTASIKL